MSMDPSSVLLTDRVAVVTGGGAGSAAVSPAASPPSVPRWPSGSATPRRRPRRPRRSDGLGITTDVRESAEVDSRPGPHAAELGPVSILVNNAGGVFFSPHPRDVGERVGRPLPGQPQARHPVHPTGGPDHGGTGNGGSIISVTSIEGVRAAPGYAAYAAAKAGVINFTKTAALELAPHGIRVNALAPDITLTEGMASVAPPGGRERFGSPCPWGDPGTSTRWRGGRVPGQ
jgi:3-oxoacyl-[acyl-carrier protein] reductase